MPWLNKMCMFFFKLLSKSLISVPTHISFSPFLSSPPSGILLPFLQAALSYSSEDLIILLAFLSFFFFLRC